MARHVTRVQTQEMRKVSPCVWHERVWGRGGIAALVFTLSTGYFDALVTLPPGKEPHLTLGCIRLGGLHIRFARFGVPLLGI